MTMTTEKCELANELDTLILAAREEGKLQALQGVELNAVRKEVRILRGRFLEKFKP